MAFPCRVHGTEKPCSSARCVSTYEFLLLVCLSIEGREERRRKRREKIRRNASVRRSLMKIDRGCSGELGTERRRRGEERICNKEAVTADLWRRSREAG